MKVLELYSGIGGMHLSLQESQVNGEVVASVDINPTANVVYKHNFPDTLLLNRNIESLTSEYINMLDVDTMLMSPPCQPFTRNGLKQDVKDARTTSFLHILNILPTLRIKRVLIENVKGFDTSEMRDRLLQTLKMCNFVFQEFILSPTQFGVPNTRHRYYCIAKKQPANFRIQTGPLMENFPTNIQHSRELQTLTGILEDSITVENYNIPDEILRKRATAMDIRFSNSTGSCCFTKSYGRYVTGTGSVFTSKTQEELDSIYEELKNYEQDTNEYLKCIKKLEVRFFTPREVCRLMSFPEMFSFPKQVTDRQKYMLLGNSINVKVVSELIKLLLD